MERSFKQIMKDQGVAKEFRSPEHFRLEEVALKDETTHWFAIPREIIYVEGVVAPSELRENGAVVSHEALVDDNTDISARAIIGSFVEIRSGTSVGYGSKISGEEDDFTFISEDVAVGAGAAINSSIIGQNTKILDRAIVNKSYVGENSSIGIKSRVDNSEIGNKVEINEQVILEGDNKVGNSSELDDGVVLKKGAIVGNNSSVSHGSILEKDANVSDYVDIGSYVSLSEGVTVNPGAIIDYNSEIGAKSVIYSGTDKKDRTKIGKNVTIDSGVNVGSGVRIANGCRVLQGSEVATNKNYRRIGTLIYPRKHSQARHDR